MAMNPLSPMKIYVASSWRNERQPAVVAALRDLGHDVYDFRNPKEGDHGFSWRQCADDAQLKDARRFRDEVLKHPMASAGFALDMNALQTARCTVLVLPCGRSAHLELGWATGMRQRTIVMMREEIDEPELMYLMCSEIVVGLEELCKTLAIHDVSVDRDVYMVHCNSGGSVYVKTLEFFREQGGFVDLWGKNWKPVVASSIEDAREKGCALFPDARPYERQAK